MKINTNSILSLSALFAAGFYAATAHADMTPTTPSPEAIQACSGKTENDACSYTKDSQPLSGTCHKSVDGKDELACMTAPDMGTKPAQ